MTKLTLPKKASGVIRLALSCLNKVEQSKLYKVDMHKWHEPNKRCSVCFAGVVMAKFLGAEPSWHGYPGDYPQGTANKLSALNCFRRGQIDIALSCMNRHLRKGIEPDRPITSYKLNSAQFKRDMRKLARDLDAAGL